MTGVGRTIRVALVALAFGPGVSWGQARTRYQWLAPRLQGLARIGGDFTTQSAGLGGLERSSPYGGSGLLRSSISQPGSFDLKRSRGTGGITGLSGLGQLKTPTGHSYRTPQANVRPATGLIASVYDQMDPKAMGGLALYLQTVGHTSQLLMLEDKAITTFVPTEPGRFQEHMAKGDKAFRVERYLKALGAFEVALTVGRSIPETHLSLVHAYFAAGQYYSAAQHLRQALKYLPELPLVQLQVRGFYGKAEDFDNHLAALEKRVLEWTDDADGRLLLAYFRYFDGADGEAAAALRQAYKLSWRYKQKETAKAVETFWEGMLAAGRAAGDLAATTRPGYLAPSKVREPTTRPAGAAKPPAGGARPRPGDVPPDRPLAPVKAKPTPKEGAP